MHLSTLVVLIFCCRILKSIGASSNLLFNPHQTHSISFHDALVSTNKDFFFLREYVVQLEISSRRDERVPKITIADKNRILFFETSFGADTNKVMMTVGVIEGTCIQDGSLSYKLQSSDNCDVLDVTYFQDSFCHSFPLSASISHFTDCVSFPGGEMTHYESIRGGCKTKDNFTFESDTMVNRLFKDSDSSCESDPLSFIAHTMEASMTGLLSPPPKNNVITTGSMFNFIFRWDLLVFASNAPQDLSSFVDNKYHNYDVEVGQCMKQQLEPQHLTSDPPEAQYGRRLMVAFGDQFTKILRNLAVGWTAWTDSALSSIRVSASKTNSRSDKTLRHLRGSLSLESESKTIVSDEASFVNEGSEVVYYYYSPSIVQKDDNNENESGEIIGLSANDDRPVFDMSKATVLNHDQVLALQKKLTFIRDDDDNNDHNFDVDSVIREHKKIALQKAEVAEAYVRKQQMEAVAPAADKIIASSSSSFPNDDHLYEAGDEGYVGKPQGNFKTTVVRAGERMVF